MAIGGNTGGSALAGLYTSPRNRSEDEDEYSRAGSALANLYRGSTALTPPEPERPSLGGEFVSAIGRGVQQMGVEYTTLGGLAADVVGAEETGLDLLESAVRQQEAIEPGTIGSIEDINSVGDFFRYAISSVGEQVPVLASVLASGGVGGATAKLAGRLVAKKALSKEALNTLANRGIFAGATAGATAIETGATGSELYAAGEGVRPGESLVAGIAKGALEAIVPLAFARRFGLGAQADDFISRIARSVDVVSSRPGRALAGAAAASVTEGVTETLQESVDLATRKFVNDNFEALGPEGRSRLLNAAATGALVGFIFGGAGGAISRPERKASDSNIAVPPPKEPATNVPEKEAPFVTEATIVPQGYNPEVSPIGDTGIGSLSFGTRFEAEQSLAQDPTAEVVGVDRSALHPTQVSANLESLVGRTLKKEDTDIALNNPKREDEALSLAQKAAAEITIARRLRNEGQIDDAATATQNAKELYDQALAAGFRLTPKEGQGFVFLGRQSELEGALVRGARLGVLPATRPSIDINAPTKIGSNIFVFGRGFKGGTGARQLDLDRVDPDSISGGEASLRSIVDENTTLEEAKAKGLRYLNSKDEEAAFKDLKLRLFSEEAIAEQFVNEGLRVPFNEAFTRSTFEDVFVKAADLSELPLLDAPVAPSAAQDANPRSTVDEQGQAYAFEHFFGKKELEGLQVQEVGATTSKPFAFSDLKAGKPVVVRDAEYDALTQKGKANLQKVMRLIQKFMRLFMPDYKLVMSVEIDVNGHKMGTHTNGAHAGYRDAGYLSLSRETLEAGGLRMATTAVHELGHAILKARFLRAPEGFQRLIIDAFHRDILSGTRGDAKNFLEQIINPVRAATFPSSKHGGPATQYDLEYFAQFEEWFAEQVARYMLSRKGGLDIVESFFKSAATQLKNLFDTVLKPFREGTFEPREAVRDWLNAVRQQKEEGKTSQYHQLFAIADQASIMVNSQALEGNNPNNVKPVFAQAENVFLDKILTNNLIAPIVGKKRGKRIKAEADHVTWIQKTWDNILQLADKFPNVSELQIYRQLIGAWSIRQAHLRDRARQTLVRWQKLSRQQDKALGDFIFYLARMDYLSEAEKEAGIVRKPNEEEMLAAIERFGISQEAFDVYQSIESDFAFTLDEMERLTKQRVTIDLAEQPEELQKVLAEINEDFSNLRQRPYFPFSRFGRNYMIIKDSDGRKVWVEAFASRRQRDRARREAEKRFPTGRGYTIKYNQLPNHSAPFQAMPRTMLEAMARKMEFSKEQRAELERLIAENAPEMSFRKHFLLREGIPGYSLDAQRAYANYFFHGSAHLARVEFAHQFQHQIDSLRKKAGEDEVKDGRLFQEIADFMQDHLNDVLNPGAQWTALRQAAFQWWLGFVPASALLNLTQVPMVAWPYLAARFGDRSAFVELTRAIKNLHQFYNLDNKTLTGEGAERLQKLLTEAIRQNIITESQAAELAGASNMDNLTPFLKMNKAQKRWHQFMQAGAFMFQTAEGLNRRVVFRAAVELALKNPEAKFIQELKKNNILEVQELLKQGFRDEEIGAFLAGKDAVNRTQFEYSLWARPKALRGRKGSILMFFNFTQNMLWFMKNSPGGGRFLLMMLVMGGLMGLPGADDAADSARVIARTLFGKDFDIETEVRQLVLGLLGDDPAVNPDIFLHGLSRAGFGMQFDMSGSLGLGSIIPGLNELNTGILNAEGFSSTFAKTGQGVAGAGLAIPINLLQAMSDSTLPIDDFKRWERAMPRAIKNLSKAVRFAVEGRERFRSAGAGTVVDFDINDSGSIAELIGQAAGLQPTRLSRRWDRESAQREVLAYWDTRRKTLLMQFNHARDVSGGGRAQLEPIYKAIRQFNREVPSGLKRITRDTLLSSAKEAARRRALTTAGQPSALGDRPIAREVQRLYPEVVDAETVR